MLAGSAPGALTPVAYDFSMGRQREQLDKRFVSGFNLSRTFVTPGSVTRFAASATP
jgi:hypothetical protein